MEQQKSPYAKNGLLDLRNWDFEKNGAVTLSGEWKIIWKPQNEANFQSVGYDDSDWDTFTAPGVWNKKTGTGYGFCWLRIRILLPKQKDLCIQLTSAFTSYTMYLNGKEFIRNGVSGNEKKATVPQIMPVLKGFTSEDTLTIAWKISNFTYFEGGPWESPRIGEYTDMYNAFWVGDIINAMLLGVFFFISLYHFILWMQRRKDIAALYLSLGSLMVFVRFVSVFQFLSRLCNSISVYELVYKLEYISTILIFIFMVNFVIQFFPDEFKIKRQALYTGFFGIYIFIIIVTDHAFYSYSYIMTLFHAVAVLVIGWAILKFIRVLKNKRDGSSLLFTGLAVLFMAILSDILISVYFTFLLRQSIIPTVHFVPFGFLFFIIIQSVLLSARFAKAHNTAEHLTKNLQKEVELQTGEINAQKLELENTAQKLREKDKYKSLFFQNLTHELRTPLSLILGPLESAINGVYGGVTEVLRRQLQITVNNARRLLDLINDLLDLARTEAGKMELSLAMTDLVRIFNYTVSAFESLAIRKNIRFVAQTNVAELRACIDLEKIEKVFHNLLSNAFKFTEEGGEITASLRIVEPAASDSNDTKTENGRSIEIRVKDTGCGIAEKDRERIFNRFEQALEGVKHFRKGTGIGLALVKDYVEMHKGTIGIESEPGKGSEFTVRIPFLENESIPKVSEKKVVVAAQESEGACGVNITDEQRAIPEKKPQDDPRYKVLVVDDNADMREYIRENARHSFLIEEAENGREALKKIAVFKPDLVLSDIMMPEMDGYELLANIRKNGELKNLPFIFISAKGYEEKPGEEHEFEPDDYLSKPFVAKELLARIHNLLTIRSQRIELSLLRRSQILPGSNIQTNTGDTQLMHPGSSLLVVDDNVEILENYKELLEANGYTDIVLCEDGRKVMQILVDHEVPVVILDLAMPHVPGKKLLREIKETRPEIEVIVVTGLGGLEDAVECMQTGAFDYMVKPVETNRLVSAIRHCIEVSNLRKDVTSLGRSIFSDRLIHPDAFSNIITRSRRMLSVFHYIESIAERPYPVLVTGESGTGKELVPPVIHGLSRRKGRFVSVNVGGVDDATFSDTLFGHVKGAYTGADTERKGLVDEAQGGTLFLDEIGELSPASQVKLLRLLQNGDYRPLGSDREKQSDARIVVATNADLAKKMEEGAFRNDLFYRFTYVIPLPPLRERKEDIPLLLNLFIAQKCESLGIEKPEINQELLALLASYGFPGNVRELETMAENALAGHSGNTLSLQTVKQHMKSQREEGAAETIPISAFSAGFDLSTGFPTLEQVKESLIEEAIHQCQGNLTAAAHMLGVTPGMLSRRKGKK